MPDGYTTFFKGMHGGVSPRILPDGFVSKAINMDFRETFPKTRGGAKKVELEFVDEYQKSAFEVGVFQGASFYRRNGNEIHVTVDGNNFRIRPDGGESRMDNPPDGPIPVSSKRVVYVEHDKFLIRQDGSSRPMIVDGITVRHPEGAEVPVGYYMASGAGYLVVSDVAKKEVRVSDYYGGNQENYAGVGDPSTPGSLNPITGEGYGPLTFNDTQAYYFGGGTLRPNSDKQGELRALIFAPATQSVTGDGPLLAIYENGVYAHNLNEARQDWVVKPITSELFDGVGGVSHQSVLHINSDVGFRSPDGIRTIAQSTAQGAQGFSTSPISNPIDCWLRYEFRELLEASSAAYWEKYWVNTIMPEYMQVKRGTEYRSEVVFRGVSVFDTDTSSGINPEGGGVWSGMWTYPERKVLQVVSGSVGGRERMYVFLKTEDGRNEIWEQTIERRDDSGSSIKSRIDFGMLRFNEPTKKKFISGVELWASEVEGDTTLKINSRWDGNSIFNEVKKLQVSSQITDISQETEFPEDEFAASFIRKRMDNEKETCENRGYEAQMQIEVDGHAQIDALIVTTGDANRNSKSDRVSGQCSIEKKSVVQSTQNDYGYTET